MPPRGPRRQPDEHELAEARVVAAQIRELRKARHLSQEQLGQAARLDRQTIGNYELSATVPSLYELTALARALGVETWQLLYPR